MILLASLQDIRHRIKSVKSTKQITSAMNMVATSRLRHAKEAATANRPYAQKVSEVVHAVAKNAGTDFSHPLLEKHEDGKKLVFLITSDKGLAGAYSSNACKAAEALIEKENDTDFVIVGRKGVGHFKSRGHNVIKEFIGISEHPSSKDARNIALELIRLYKTGEYREIVMVYTKFISAISCEPKSGHCSRSRLSRRKTICTSSTSMNRMPPRCSVSCCRSISSRSFTQRFCSRLPASSPRA